MGAFSKQKEQRGEVSRFWNGEYDGDTIRGTVVSAGMVPNTFKPGEEVPELVLNTDRGEVTVTATRKVLANLIVDLDPDTGDVVELTRTGVKPSNKPGFQPAVLFSGTKNGSAPESKASDKKPF